MISIPKQIVVSDRSCDLNRLGSTVSRYVSASVLYDGRPIASIGFVDGAANDAHVARASIALDSYLQSGGVWSYLGEGGEQMAFADLESSVASLDKTCELLKYDHFVEHWAFERVANGYYARFLIWKKDVARDVFLRVRESPCRVMSSGFDHGYLWN